MTEDKTWSCVGAKPCWSSGRSGPRLGPGLPCAVCSAVSASVLPAKQSVLSRTLPEAAALDGVVPWYERAALGGLVSWYA